MSCEHGPERLQINRRQLLSLLPLFLASCLEQRTPSEVKEFYPELEGYKLRNRGKIKTPFSQSEYLNFTSANFNPEIAEEIITYFESIARKNWLIQYHLNNNSTPFLLQNKPGNQRLIFIVPESAPAPKWRDLSRVGTATTTGMLERRPHITFVRAVDTEDNLPPSLVFNTPVAASSKAFSVEACQSSISVSSINPDIANFGQEIICNSLGEAFSLKQQEFPYERYKNWAQEVLIRKNPNSSSYPLYVLREEEYSQIPTIGHAIIPQ